LNSRTTSNNEMRRIAGLMYPKLNFDKAMYRMVQDNLVVVCSKNKKSCAKTYNVMDFIIQKYS